MSLNDLDVKRIYYYAVCVMAFFVLMWGTVDLASSSIGLFSIKGSFSSFTTPAGEAPLASEKGEQFFDAYYQRKMLFDRLWDSVARIVVAGIIFAYFRFTANKLEKQA
jgi:hypothetical protein